MLLQTRPTAPRAHVADPSPETIRRRAEQIRRGWSPAEHAVRRSIAQRLQQQLFRAALNRVA